ncbi:hypothetical protein [Burkholderia cenocepacia]|uniref:hypothetical protein n=1 Tax=Burkholderia cenocepacia TaxID=95486 RepID=UPI001B8EFF54|nr:hypothetical protein [Burkholderia cenocepacia]MBR8099129.1 hypothetical protein [Burkholderia cenocepacia]MDI9686330.1 hypothetical protein [Burkholderia cenocepacia]HEP6432916.1 hypothetical protein [Burkholderia cenocepacia]
MIYQYCQEAKDRISAMGQPAITQFIEEIPQNLRKAIYDRMPRLQGFRPGSQAEFKAIQKRLINHLVHSQTSPTEIADWRVFSRLWGAWARERLGALLPQTDESEPPSDASAAFLLNVGEHFPDASKEDVERLFAFSGFPDTPGVSTMLARFRSASAISREKMIDGIPARLGEFNARIEGAEAAVKRIDRLEATSSLLTEKARDTEKGTNRALDAISELHTLLDRESRRVEALEKNVGSLETACTDITDVAAAASSRVDALEQSIKTITITGAEWDKAETRLKAIENKIADLLTCRVTSAATSEAIDRLDEKMTALEGMLAKRMGQSESTSRTHLIRHTPAESVVEILSAEDARDVVTSNLLAIGVAKGAAINIAQSAVAAFIAGQMVQFSGSLADLAADAIAAAVGGLTYHEWRVPVGLVSDEAASYCIEAVTTSSDCLLLKRANLSAFEVYGTAVRDVLVHRQFSIPDCSRLALIASWAQGPAAFPNGGTLSELGPVFDTDNLPIRGPSAKLPPLKFGRLGKDTWAQIDGIAADAPAPAASELGELMKEAGFEGGAIWKRVASRAYAALRAMPGRTAEDDLHSLLISWAIPWAKATNGPAEELARIAERELTERRSEPEA